MLLKNGHEKRSMRINNHYTSVALEPEFWAVLTALAKRDGLSLSAYIGRLDPGYNLTSTLRVHCLVNHAKVLTTTQWPAK
jgi:predicted DNA-binding ribbon-helix-helix protein